MLMVVFDVNRVIGSKIQVAGWTTYSLLIGFLKLSVLAFYIRLTVRVLLSTSIDVSTFAAADFLTRVDRTGLGGRTRFASSSDSYSSSGRPWPASSPTSSPADHSASTGRSTRTLGVSAFRHGPQFR